MVLLIGSIVLIFFLFRWAGIKGLITFSVGMLIMAYLILSKNAMLMFIIEKTSSDTYIDEIKK